MCPRIAAATKPTLCRLTSLPEPRDKIHHQIQRPVLAGLHSFTRALLFALIRGYISQPRAHDQTSQYTTPISYRHPHFFPRLTRSGEEDAGMNPRWTIQSPAMASTFFILPPLIPDEETKDYPQTSRDLLQITRGILEYGTSPAGLTNRRSSPGFDLGLVRLPRSSCNMTRFYITAACFALT